MYSLLEDVDDDVYQSINNQNKRTSMKLSLWSSSSSSSSPSSSSSSSKPASSSSSSQSTSDETGPHLKSIVSKFQLHLGLNQTLNLRQQTPKQQVDRSVDDANQDQLIKVDWKAATNGNISNETETSSKNAKTETETIKHNNRRIETETETATHNRKIEIETLNRNHPRRPVPGAPSVHSRSTPSALPDAGPRPPALPPRRASTFGPERVYEDPTTGRLYRRIRLAPMTPDNPPPMKPMKTKELKGLVFLR